MSVLMLLMTTENKLSEMFVDNTLLKILLILNLLLNVSLTAVFVELAVRCTLD